MHPLHYSSSFLFLTIVIASVRRSIPFKIIKDEAKFEACSCFFECGKKNFGYPFWGGNRSQDCGHPDFKLECHNNIYPQVKIISRNFYILDTRERDQTLTVVGADMVDDGCPEIPANTTVDDSPFECASNNDKLVYVYNCSNGIPNTVSSELRCARKLEPVYDGYYVFPPEFGVGESQSCSLINVPFLQKYHTDVMTHFMTAKDALKKGFDLKYKEDYGQGDCWECLQSGWQCGFNRTLKEFVCFSQPGMHL